MYKLLILLGLFFTTQTFADGVTQLKDGDLRLSQADAKITDVREICPTNSGGIRCMALGSIVTIKVTMNGCLDSFGGYFSRFKVINNKGYLFFGSLNIFNEASMVTRCVQAPTKSLEIHIPFNGEVSLVNIEYMGTTTLE
jgi:hypothetical protein